MNAILLSHVFIRQFEPYKVTQVEFALKHYRDYNPNATIILTGHGIKPNVADYADFIFWNDEIIESEINVGHPYLVNKGIDIAIANKCDKICKCRADGVILIRDLLEYCELKLGPKQLLLTQQTKLEPVHAGDLFLYCESNLMKKIWDISDWYPTNTGLSSLARNILKTYNMQGSEWKKCLKNYTEFVDIYNLKWVDFRANWDKLKHKIDNIYDEDFNYIQYLWGQTEGWHVFDSDGNLTNSNIPNMLSRMDWLRLIDQ